ncbi:hypothetical protein GCM10010168_19960 [Actinoplanes ianthinogenes]|uniref:Uncharacterized protein n=1 Tax=Actinoplanes ianthinogenes TaxID=122358 RepID=A0ABM7M7K2_9ACTN|nr:hypothetical protein [Actinoplanes ianthinogenes]BCJ47638.1 hypothetical protein Aiant_82950 [Actinoplanes ianthinogenes]GGR03101.1 hypothetical protein GCM10010168_19960 [Actinoplanes ianthinogenes]
MTDIDLEHRLRRALSARAATVTSQDLRPASAPARAERRGVLVRWWLPLTAGVAAAAVTITAFALLRPADPASTPPAAPASPSVGVPAPEVTPGTSPPAPSPSSTAGPAPSASEAASSAAASPAASFTGPAPSVSAGSIEVTPR